MPGKIGEIFLSMFKKLWRQGSMPEDWKKGNMFNIQEGRNRGDKKL